MLALLLCLTPAAGARPLLVNTDPPGARITDQYGNYLGLSGSVMQVDLSNYGSSLELTLQLEGYESKLETLKTQPLKEDMDHWPRQGSIALQPKSSWVRLESLVRQNTLPLTVVSLLGLGAALALARQVGALRTKATRWEREQARMREVQAGEGDILVGKELAGHLLVEKLGEGGMARVYRGLPADTADPSRAVAVKVLANNEWDSQEFSLRFQREVEICRRLHHPNIVHLIDWHSDKSRTLLVMELVEGNTLRHRVAPQGLPLGEAMSYMAPIMDAVAYAHARQIVHRDLKPENVMLTPKGVVKVMDFGLARTLDSEKVTKTGNTMGTPAYMAPEQLQAHDLEPAVDQYALGCLAFELLTGRPPFVGEAFQVITGHLTQEPPGIVSLRPDLPPALTPVVARMLAKDPKQRYPSVSLAAEAMMQAAGVLS